MSRSYHLAPRVVSSHQPACVGTETMLLVYGWLGVIALAVATASYEFSGLLRLLHP